jgi:capsular polysaccharide biosynthesis protein
MNTNNVNVNAKAKANEKAAVIANTITMSRDWTKHFTR